MKVILDYMPYLTVFPYALLYYLFLLAASGLALLEITRAKQEKKKIQSKKCLSALLVTFFSQLVLLTLSLLQTQGADQIGLLFPILQRALFMVSLVWIIWAILDIRTVGWLEYLPLGLTLLMVLAASLAFVLWLPTAASIPFNGSWLDKIWNLTALVLLLAGILVFLRKTENRKPEGILVMAIAALGLLVYLLFPNSGMLPGAVLLSQLLYYPLLIGIAWQSLAPEPVRAVSTQEAATTEQSNKGYASSQLANALLDTGLETSISGIYQELAHSLSLYMLADICALVENQPEQEKCILLSAYDLIREDFLHPVELQSSALPTFTANLEDGTPLIANTCTDLAIEKEYLQNKIGYNQMGNLMLYPFYKNEAFARYALLFLSPYTARSWSEHDAQRVEPLCSRITQIIQNAADVEKNAHKTEALRINANQLRRERNRLQEQVNLSQKLLDDLRKDFQDNQLIYQEEVQVWVERQKLLEETMDTLQQTLAEQETLAQESTQLKAQKELLEVTLANQQSRISDLRQALDNARSVMNQLVFPDNDNPPSPGLAAPELNAVNRQNPMQDITTIFHSDLDEILHGFSARGITLAEDIDALPELESEQLNLLRSVLKDLASNAFSASPNNSEVNVSVICQKVDPNTIQLEFQVTDYGGGLSEQEQSHFLQFLTRPGHPVPSGIGDPQALRSAITSVQERGGHWWIHSEIDEPTTYRVAIPLSTGNGKKDTEE